MHETQLFKHELFGEIRTMTDEQGEPWFVGKDVAEALRYMKPLNAIATHVDEDDSLKQGLIDCVGRTQKLSSSTSLASTPSSSLLSAIRP